MVCRWGAYAGEPDLLRSPDPHNPQGYWEYTPVWDFLVQLGDLDRGSRWWRSSFQELVAHRLTVPKYADHAAKMVSAMETDRPWVWKDPALCFFLPFWNGIWRRPIFVVAVRNPYDTAVSWDRFVMAGIVESPADPVPVNLLRWQYMVLLILSNTPRQTPTIFLPYEQLMRRPTICAKRLAEFLDHAADATRTSQDTVRSMADAVHPELWHQRKRPRLRQVPGATVEQEALYGLLRRRVVHPSSPFIAARYPMPPGWEDVVEEREATLRQQRTKDGTAGQEP